MAAAGMDRRRVYEFMSEEVMAEAAAQQAPAIRGGLLVDLGDDTKTGPDGSPATFPQQSPRAARQRAEQLAVAVKDWQSTRDPTELAPTTPTLASASTVQILACLRPANEQEMAAEGTPTDRGAPLYCCVTALPGSAQLALHSESPALGGAPTGNLRTSLVKLHGAIKGRPENDELFAALKPSLSLAGEGGQVHIIAHGTTGAGKTHSSQAAAHLAVDVLFSSGRGQLAVSFYEVAGNRCYDLLSSVRQEVSILEDGVGKICLKDLSQVLTGTPAEASKAVARGFQERKSAATEANSRSSRTHGICELRLHSDAQEGTLGCVRIVDLAGSERSQDTLQHSAERMQETKDVNSSLACLRDCIKCCAAAAAAKPKAKAKAKAKLQPPPFRRSKLTLLLRSCFEGEPGTCCIWLAHVAPMSANLGATRATLKCASELLEACQQTHSAGAVAPVSWSRSRVGAWLRGHDGGRFEHLVEALAWADGHALGKDWPRDVAARAAIAGVSEDEILAVCEAFRIFCKSRADGKPEVSKDVDDKAKLGE